MSLTAVALVAADASGKVVPGIIALLKSPDVPGGILADITNRDGYMVFNNVPTPFSGMLRMTTGIEFYEQPVNVSGSNVTIRVGPTPSNPQDIHLPPCVPSSFNKPFQIAPRFWNGQMGGLRIPGLPFVAGMEGAPSGLFLSWFYDRYDAETRATIRAAMQGRGYTHWLLSWPDSRAFGLSQFTATCQELIAAGFYPCVMLSSKDFDPPNVDMILDGVKPVLDALVGLVPMFCVGWELSLWLSPTQVQTLIDALAPRWLKQAGTLGYVHFQEGYPSFQQPGGTVADFWKLQIGKLTGLLYQKILAQNDAQFLDSINDCLERFAGGFNMPTGFDFIALEISAMQQFNGTCSEAEGDRLGRLAINAPKVNGVGVMGSGNGS